MDALPRLEGKQAMSEYEATLRDHERTIDELQKKLMWAREAADFRKIAVDRLQLLLDSMTAERDLLLGNIERLEQRFATVEDDRNRWRKAFLKQAEQFGTENNQP